MARADLEVAFPEARASLAGGGDGARWRVLVPVGASGYSVAALSLAGQVAVATGGLLRVVHVRVFDPPVRGGARFYPESSLEATALLDTAVASAWASGARTSGIVVDAPRSQVGRAITTAARDWNAALIVVARRRRLVISRLVLGSVADQVMRYAASPVLVVRPGPR